MFNVGDTVWFVRSGNNERYVECPDCLGQCALTVIMGDGSEVSIDCECCREGYRGCRGQIKTYDWNCNVASGVITGMEIDGNAVRYKFAYAWPDAVFGSKEEAEAEAVKVLAAHEADEAHRLNNVKDHKGRHRSWAWSATYHRRQVKEAKRQLEYHESRLAVAKVKAKTPEASEAA